MRYPPNYQTTSTQESLSNGPADMPDRGMKKGMVQTSSSTVPLSRTENHVAAMGAHPSMGMVQTSSTKTPLARGSVSPYEKLSRTTPQVSGPGKKRR